ncbi:hypothetical protein [Sphingomonas sp. Mn802worker]|uniref:hypothetical protein n=1 Tax=Sphingomonas sp. Mn802worker TaxID=629773 RepID=UPI0012E9C851|nr:hypothetical protein [Sphingomonas sp. Mn802worker]
MRLSTTFYARRRGFVQVALQQRTPELASLLNRSAGGDISAVVLLLALVLFDSFGLAIEAQHLAIIGLR